MPQLQDHNELQNLSLLVGLSINDSQPLANSFGIIQSESFAAHLGAH